MAGGNPHSAVPAVQPEAGRARPVSRTASSAHTTAARPHGPLAAPGADHSRNHVRPPAGTHDALLDGPARPDTAALPEGAPPGVVRLAVYAADPITQLALVSYVRRQPHLLLAGWGAAADIVVAVLHNPDGDALVRLCGQIAGEPPLVVIAEDGWSADFHTALDLGVRAVICRRDFTWEHFAETLREVHAGHGNLPPPLLGRMMDQMRHTHREVLAPRGLTPGGLTTREADVLRLIADGYELADIGTTLGYSERTVKNALYAVIKRHGLRNRAHAVAHAIKHGLI